MRALNIIIIIIKSLDCDYAIQMCNINTRKGRQSHSRQPSKVSGATRNKLDHFFNLNMHFIIYYIYMIYYSYLHVLDVMYVALRCVTLSCPNVNCTVWPTDRYDDCEF